MIAELAWLRPQLLPVALGLAVALASAAAATTRHRTALGTPTRPRGARRLLRVAGWLGLCGAIVGPARVGDASPTAVAPTVVRVAVDVSRSMAVGEDVTRLDHGILALRDLLSRLPDAEVGVAVFGSSAHVVVPPTADRTIVDAHLGALAPGLLDRGGTRGSALAGLVDAVRADPGSDRRRSVLLVVSDGEWEDEAVPFDGEGVVLHAIWTDRPATGAVPGAGPGAASSARREALKRAVTETGGVFASAGDAPALARLADAILSTPSAPRRGFDPSETGRSESGGTGVARPGTAVDRTADVALLALLLLLAGHPVRRGDR